MTVLRKASAEGAGDATTRAGITKKEKNCEMVIHGGEGGKGGHPDS